MEILRRNYLKLFKRIILALMPLSLLVFLFLNLQQQTPKINLELFFPNYTRSIISFNFCRIPDYDPFDKTILKYITSWRPIRCGNNQPYLTYVDSDGYIHINETGAEEAGYELEDLGCTYSEVIRSNMRDDKVTFSEPFVFKNPEKIPSEFVKAECFSKARKLIYETVHAYVRPLSEELKLKNKRVNISQPSVLIIVFEGTSRLNFIRQLPKSYNYIVNVLNATVLKGLVKSGVNTYPNMVAFLSGMNSEKDHEHIPFWLKDSNRTGVYFDNMPLAWKNFSDKGYITMYMEDRTLLSTFNYYSNGFKYKPTDYYMRPFWLALRNIQHFKSWDEQCISNIPIHQYLFDYLHSFTFKMHKNKYFSFVFVNDISHNYMNSIKVIDDDVLLLLSRMHTSGSLENTVTIVMGDTGCTLDHISESPIGSVEDKMPFFSIKLPQYMEEDYPHLMYGIKGNEEVLLSWFDMYELLMDIVMMNFGIESQVVRWGWAGLSPFRPIPKNRTCYEIGIPAIDCICSEQIFVPLNNTEVETAAHSLVNHVNDLLSAEKNNCVPLTLDNITNAYLQVPEEEKNMTRVLIIRLVVTVRVLPSKGLLEGLLNKYAGTSSYNVIGRVNRINRFGNQSHCIIASLLKEYCYCRDLVPA